MKKIYLDIDGVLANFIQGIAKLFERDYEELISSWIEGSHKIEDMLKVSRGTFYRKLDGAGEQFWANLELFPHSMDLFKHCKRIAPTYLLTKPSNHPSSSSGKVEWINKHFGYGFNKYVLAPDKTVCSRPDVVLIDDYEFNIKSFKLDGGKTILFPSITNSRYKERHDCFQIVKNELKELLERA